jgi:addiction module HigA family antidote
MAKAERNHVHPGEILLEKYMKPLGLTQYRLAKELRVSPIRVNQIIHGKRAVSADTAVRLGCLLNMDPLYWMNLQNAYDLKAAMDEFYESIYKSIKPLLKTLKKPKVSRAGRAIAAQYDRGANGKRRQPDFSDILQEGLDRFFVNFKVDKKIRK